MKIAIKNPCPANWNEMSPTTGGRHCASCNKTVVDFTQMKPEEIQHYFKSKGSKPVCGHLHVTQLSKTNLHPLIRLKDKIVIRERLPMRFAALIVVGLLISLAGCDNKMNTGEIDTKACDTNNQTLTGDTIITTTNHDTVSAQEVISGKVVLYE